MGYDAIAGGIVFLTMLGLIKAVWPKSNAAAASEAAISIAEPKPLPKVITDRISIEQAIADIAKPTCIVVYDYCAQIHFDRRMIPLQQIHEALALAGWKCPYPPIWSERTSILTIVKMPDV